MEVRRRTPRQIRRWTLGALARGVVLTVLVAWAGPHIPKHWFPSSGGDLLYWSSTPFCRTCEFGWLTPMGSSVGMLDRMREDFEAMLESEVLPPPGQKNYNATAVYTESGFPYRALRGWQIVPYKKAMRPTTAGAIPIGNVALPCCPLARGFLADVLIWGMPARALSSLLARSREWLRRRRGRCTRCGYPLGGLSSGSPCPECGGRL